MNYSAFPFPAPRYTQAFQPVSICLHEPASSPGWIVYQGETFACVLDLFYIIMYSDLAERAPFAH